MATVTEIGSLISRRPEIRGGRPCIAGTGVSVRRIAQWHNMGRFRKKSRGNLATFRWRRFMRLLPTITPTRRRLTRTWIPRRGNRGPRRTAQALILACEPDQDLHRRRRDGQRSCCGSSFSRHHRDHGFGRWSHREVRRPTVGLRFRTRVCPLHVQRVGFLSTLQSGPVLGESTAE